jgi:hypothetical protein
MAQDFIQFRPHSPMCARFIGHDCKWSPANGSRIALRPATLTRGTNQQETNLATLKIDGEDRGCEAPDDTPVCSENLNAGVVVVKSAQDGA